MGIMDNAFPESGTVSLQQLLLPAFDEEQLDVAIDSLAPVGSADAKQHSPLFLRVQLVAHNLGIR
jgi:hypothetical protein